MSNGPYPDPTFLYHSAVQTVHPLRIGPFRVDGACAAGTNYWADPEARHPDVRIRPSDGLVDADDPCTTAFTVFYSQYRKRSADGVPFKMYFRVTTDEAGGAVGADASLEVVSNYPDINMDLARFPVNQPGVGRMKEAWIPADYQANMTVRVWNNDADLSVDGYVMLECGYKEIPPDNARAGLHRRGRGRKDREAPPLYSETAETTTDPGLIPVGRVSLYPVQTPDC